jgi:hypothetical protein
VRLPLADVAGVDVGAPTKFFVTAMAVNRLSGDESVCLGTGVRVHTAKAPRSRRCRRSGGVGKRGAAKPEQRARGTWRWRHTHSAPTPAPWAAGTRPGTRTESERTTSPTEGLAGAISCSCFGLKTKRAPALAPVASSRRSHRVCIASQVLVVVLLPELRLAGASSLARGRWNTIAHPTRRRRGGALEWDSWGYNAARARCSETAPS